MGCRTSYHQVVLGTWQFLRDPSQRGNQRAAVAAEPVRQEIHSGHQVLHLAPLPDLVEGVIAVRGGVWQCGAEEGLKEERGQEAGLQSQAQVRGQNISFMQKVKR